MKLFLFLILSSNFIFLLMSETLMLGYAQTIGILALGIFTVIWNNRRKKEVEAVKATVKEEVSAVKDQVKQEVGAVKQQVTAVKTEIDGHMQNLLKVTGEAEKAKGNKEGRSELVAEGAAISATTKEIIDAVKENTIQAIKERNPAGEPLPVKVIIVEPADVKIVEDKTKKDKT